ncbi:transcription factor bHLH162 [Arachis ipaensis]|uniref:transcription factor bHLH162 n=1 Tax=Arachis ipaensis TaxID=130454 RepID=UPI0007AF49EA|nr:transcription factor bHLH162 [Arachis ipaensis]
MENKHHPDSTCSTRTERKFIERERRNQMKALYSNLNSLLPHFWQERISSLPDQLEEATNYIKKLQVKLEKMKEKKNTLLGTIHQIPNNRGILGNGGSGNNNNVIGIRSPQIEIQQMGFTLMVVLITALDSHYFMFIEAIRVLHEEGADVVSASYKVVQHAVFHTMHCQVGEYGNGAAARISERLKKFVNDSTYCPF